MFNGNKMSTFTTGQTTGQPYTLGQTWGAIRKAWKAYKIAKVQHVMERMKEYAGRIRTLQTQLGVPQTSFPDVGL